MKRFEYLYDYDRRALADFVSCTESCNDCRARAICDEYTSSGAEKESEWLMGEWDGDVPGRTSFSEMLGMREWGPDLLCEYIDGMLEEVEKRDKLISDMLASGVRKGERKRFEARADGLGVCYACVGNTK